MPWHGTQPPSSGLSDYSIHDCVVNGPVRTELAIDKSKSCILFSVFAGCLLLDNKVTFPYPFVFLKGV